MTLKSNTDELALIVQEIGVQVIRGPDRYPERPSATIHNPHCREDQRKGQPQALRAATNQVPRLPSNQEVH
jgi:hypothetical protein